MLLWPMRPAFDAYGDIAMFRLMFAYLFTFVGLFAIYASFHYIWEGYFQGTFIHAIMLVFGCLLSIAGICALISTYGFGILDDAWKVVSWPALCIGIALLVVAKVMEARGIWSRFRRGQMMATGYFNNKPAFRGHYE